MIMPFGVYKGKEVDTLPDSMLRWIIRKISVEPPATVRPENREKYKGDRAQLIAEASRELRTRRLNGVTVKDTAPKKTNKSKYNMKEWRW